MRSGSLAVRDLVDHRNAKEVRNLLTRAPRPFQVGVIGQVEPILIGVGQHQIQLIADLLSPRTPERSIHPARVARPASFPVDTSP